MKVTYTKVASRKILLAFLAVVIILAIAALFVRNSIANKLERVSILAHNMGLDQEKPQHALMLVYQAEDAFQQSLLSPGAAKTKDYKTKLSLAFNAIDSLLKGSPDTSNLTAEQYSKVHEWYGKKLALADKMAALRGNFNTMLKESGDNGPVPTADVPVVTNINVHHNSHFSKSDTTKKSLSGKKKGLFGRIKDAIVNKNGTPVSVVEINHNRTNKIVDSTTSKIIARNKAAFNQRFSQLQQRNAKMLATQKDLVSLNIRITSELEQVINQEKDINTVLQNELNAMVLKSYHDTTQLLNGLYFTALLLVLIFSILLIIYIVKLDKSEIGLLEENDRAVNIAKQKMELLLHMSHEIRNPLTSIQGFLYIFSKSGLTERQSEMVESISQSSDMLLRTLNDTLDAAKIESNEFKINSEPFNADYILREVTESMTFSAAKKDLDIAYAYEGDKDVILLGDSFRLKQVMVNLLSNAIKYTNTGGIKINAKLELVNDENQLQVAVTDTGEGISAGQQANLFSKYYQTNSAKGKMGTGLGLFICKELVQLQKGQISVKSEVGKGATFSFNIPYTQNIKKGTADEPVVRDPLSLLFGKKILAVDDNELNVVFLKMIMSKWNIRFFKASNGLEALNIIETEDIKLVITDIQMPVMGGNELLTAIKKLKKPMNQVPVIAMGGAQINTEKMLKKGFSGVVVKPFVEADLAKQIVAALKL